MTLRTGPDGKPEGLDWAAISAACPQDPSVWGTLPTAPKLTRPRVPGNRVTPAIEQQIISLYSESEMTGVAISEAVGVRHATVYRVLQRNNVEPRTKGNRGRAA
jgi:hypothetical protein